MLQKQAPVHNIWCETLLSGRLGSIDGPRIAGLMHPTGYGTLLSVQTLIISPTLTSCAVTIASTCPANATEQSVDTPIPQWLALVRHTPEAFGTKPV